VGVWVAVDAMVCVFVGCSVSVGVMVSVSAGCKVTVASTCFPGDAVSVVVGIVGRSWVASAGGSLASGSCCEGPSFVAVVSTSPWFERIFF
jgi:hypothetical protein